MFNRLLGGAIVLVVMGSLSFSAEPLSELTDRDGLTGHWKLQVDCQDSSGKGNHGTGRNLTFGPGPNDSVPKAAVFDGQSSLIEVVDAESLHLGKRDFSLAVWVKPKAPMTGVFGDIVSKFDPKHRKGINFNIAGSSSAYNGMCDARHVHFGIDNGYLGPWIDCGKPCLSNSLITCLTVFEGQLYCGIADAHDSKDAAHVFRWAGGDKWIDCGRLGDDPNHLSVQSMIAHGGKLYAGTGIWDWERARGQVPGKPPAAKPRVFVYEGGAKWRDLGQVGETSRVLCMASFKGELYVGLDRVDRVKSPGKCFKYNGSAWEDCGAPDQENFENLLPLGGVLYAATHGSVYQYAGGKKWTCIGDHPFGVTQIHSLDVYQGKLHAGTWPQGYVLRYEGDKSWTNTGRLGLPPGDPECNEVNDLIVHNGKLYAGVLPKSELYRYETDGQWTMLHSLGQRTDWARNEYLTWCRLTALASHQGQLFAGTGSCTSRAADGDPDRTMGRVYSIQAGQVVSHEHDIGGGWTHLAAVRRGAQLRLYVNGRLSVSSHSPEGRVFDLTNSEPLRIGFGAQTHFSGALADMRLYDRSLNAEEVKLIHEGKTAAKNSPPAKKTTYEPIGYTTYPDFIRVMEGKGARYPALTRVSDPGSKEHPIYTGFFFYQCLQFDATGRFLLGMKVDFEKRDIRPSDQAEVGYFDLQARNKWTKIGETTAWNWQQGARLQWRPKSDEIVWNDRSDDRQSFVCRVIDFKTGQKRTLPRPIYDLSPDGSTALTHDFEGDHQGTDYAAIADKDQGPLSPSQTGIWKMNLDSGKAELIMPLDKMAAIAFPRGIPKSGRFYIFREGWNPSGTRFVTFVKDPENRLFEAFSMSANGTDARYLYRNPSHHAWQDDDQIFDFGRHRLPGTDQARNGYYLFRDDGSGLAKELLWPVDVDVDDGYGGDGHGSFVPGTRQEWIISDTYNIHGFQHLFLFHRPTKLFVPLAKLKCTRPNDVHRVDTHPRLSRDGRTVSIDASHQDLGRQMYVMDIGPILDHPPDAPNLVK